MTRGVYPTREGWMLIAAGLLALIAANSFGIPEMGDVGLFLVLLAAFGLVIVRMRRRRVEVSRSIRPSRPHAGSEVEIRIEVTNLSSSPLPKMTYVEKIPQELGGPIERPLPPAPAGRSSSARLGLPVPRRGRFQIAPGIVTFHDPLGVANSVEPGPSAQSLFVYPRVVKLSPPPMWEVFAGGSHPNSPVSAHGEFFTIREYQSGDDMRKIHWKSTARFGRPMIRQEEIDREPRATVLIDNRHQAHPSNRGFDSFEAMMVSAASLVRMILDMGLSMRVLTAARSSVPTAYGAGETHFHRIMEHLSCLSPSSSRAISSEVRELSGPGFLAMCLTDVEPGITPALGGSHGGSRRLAVVHSAGSGDEYATPSTRHLSGAGVVTVVVGPHKDLGRAWNSAFAGSLGNAGGGGAPRAWVP